MSVISTFLDESRRQSCEARSYLKLFLIGQDAAYQVGDVTYNRVGSRMITSVSSRHHVKKVFSQQKEPTHLPTS